MDFVKVVCLVLLFCLVPNSALKLSIIHLNDFHARFEETSTSSGTCKSDDCIGGFSRVYTLVNQLYNELPNPIFLNAGDNFQGTLWYTLFKWNVTQYFLNMLPTDAMTIGNHEFDDKIAGIVPFLKSFDVQKIVVSNIDDSLEPDIQGLYQKSIVIEREGKKIGIVGVILSTTNQIASTENLKFLDESTSVNAEAQRLFDEEGVFTVIVLSHCGYEVEQQIARKAIPGISVVVGAHSHTLLYTGTPPFGTAYGQYPTEIVNENSGEKVLVVQAHAYTTYLGKLSVEYDDDGKLIDWYGNPIHLGQDIAQDDHINELLEPYRLQVAAAGEEVIGKTKVLLDRSTCHYAECNFGNLIADIMVAYYAEFSTDTYWTRAAIAFINAGGLRTSIDIGDVTYNDLSTAIPFENTIDYGELQGKYIKSIMETASAPYNSKRVYADLNLLQVSGIRVVIDASQPIGSRVTSLEVRCHECDIPVYEDIDLEKYYPIAVLSFLVDGGDGFTDFRNIINHTVGPTDIEIVSKYIKKHSPLISGLDERITVIASDSGNIAIAYHG